MASVLPILQHFQVVKMLEMPYPIPDPPTVPETGSLSTCPWLIARARDARLADLPPLGPVPSRHFASNHFAIGVALRWSSPEKLPATPHPISGAMPATSQTVMSLNRVPWPEAAGVGATCDNGRWGTQTRREALAWLRQATWECVPAAWPFGAEAER